MTRIKVRQDDLSWRTVGDDVVVLDERNSIYLQLPQTGALLWPALVAGATLDDLADSLVQRFGIAADIARRDVQAFLDDLLKRGILVSA